MFENLTDSNSDIFLICIEMRMRLIIMKLVYLNHSYLHTLQ